MGRYARQLKALVRRGILVKLSGWKGSLVELALPIAFSSLLVLLKTIADIQESPNVAYSCGPAAPFDARPVDAGVLPPTTESLAWLGCFIMPQSLPTPPNGECLAPDLPEDGGNSYYQNQIAVPDLGFSFAASLGYVNFLAFPVAPADDPFAPASALLRKNAPSLPLLTMMERLAGVKCSEGACPSCADGTPAGTCSDGSVRDGAPAVLALAPETDDATLTAAATAFRAWLLNELNTLTGTDQVFDQYVRLFDRETGANSLEEYVKAVEYDAVPPVVDKVGIALVIQTGSNPATNEWVYAIRANYTSPIFGQQAEPTPACLYNGRGSDCGYAGGIPPTNIPSLTLQLPISGSNTEGYGYSGFLTLQNTMNRYILSTAQTPPVEIALTPSVALMPTKAFRRDNFFDLAGNLLGLFFMLSFIFPVSRFVRAIVLDKEKRIKESMKIMGLRPSVIDLAWFCTIGFQMLVAAIGVAIIINTGVFTYSNPFLVFVFLLSFTMTIVTLCFLFAAFFSKSKTAAIAGPMLFFVLYFPFYAVEDPSASTAAKEALCLFAPTCMALGMGVITDFESGQVGLQWDNISEETGNISFLACLLWMWFDFFLYGALAVYLDKVLPSEFGTRRPWNYPCLCTKDGDDRGPAGPVGSGLSESLLDGNGGGGGGGGFTVGLDRSRSDDTEAGGQTKLEPVSRVLLKQREEGRCISVCGLRKEFSAGDTGGDVKVAVNDLHLEMYEGQICVLLGHNGAVSSFLGHRCRRLIARNATINMLPCTD